ncbi:uncharacterized protein [Cherax quadricarinatus]|uniref:uncharacterized protein isoform X2 n=1 Tax=Cherax quadricarinatus TaxID=27406 RepID=UPI00387ED9C2
MDGGLLSLRWNDHRQTFFKMLSGVRKREAYCDVTLACDGRFYPVHKLVLSTCSDFFDEMFEKTACKHPVIVVANVAYKDLEALLNYMYLGEVNVLQNDLTGLMKAAEALRIKGLAEPVNAPSTKDIRESKRSSLWEDDLPDGKRKRSEEVPPTATTDNDRTGRREMQKSRITSNDSETSRHKAQVPSSGSNSSNSTDQPGATSSAEMLSHSANQDMGASSQSDADNEPVDKALRPEVKMEDVLVKEEPAGWFPETEEGLDSLQFSEADTGLAYAPQQTTFRSGCLPWELAAAAATQAHVLDSQLPHGLPGPSRMQGRPNKMCSIKGCSCHCQTPPCTSSLPEVEEDSDGPSEAGQENAAPQHSGKLTHDLDKSMDESAAPLKSAKFTQHSERSEDESATPLQSGKLAHHLKASNSKNMMVDESNTEINCSCAKIMPRENVIGVMAKKEDDNSVRKISGKVDRESLQQDGLLTLNTETSNSEEKDVFSNCEANTTGNTDSQDTIPGAIPGDGRFLEISELFNLVLLNTPCGREIPAGRKDNVYFLMDNRDNVRRRKMGMKSKYKDDCGEWSTKGSCNRHYYMLHKGRLAYLIKKNGLYCREVKNKPVPIEPQPSESDIVIVNKYHVFLKRKVDYKRRISFFEKLPLGMEEKTELAVVEYVGTLE